jgi:hypothetical protein
MVTMETVTNLNILNPKCTSTHPKNFPTKFRYNQTNNFVLTFMVTIVNDDHLHVLQKI